MHLRPLCVPVDRDRERKEREKDKILPKGQAARATCLILVLRCVAGGMPKLGSHYM